MQQTHLSNPIRDVNLVITVGGDGTYGLAIVWIARFPF